MQQGTLDPAGFDVRAVTSHMKTTDEVLACIDRIDAGLFGRDDATALGSINCESSLRDIVSVFESVADGAVAYDDYRVTWLTGVDVPDVEAVFRMATQIVTTGMQMKYMSASDDATGAMPAEASFKLRRATEHLQQCMHVLKASMAMAQNSDPHNTEPANVRQNALVSTSAFGATASRDDFDTDFQFLCVMLTREAQKMGIGRRNGLVYARHRHPETNHLTYSWESRGTVKEWIYEICSSEQERPEIWKAFTGCKPCIPEPSLTKYLVNGRIPEFPVVVPDRHVFAFRNGIYFARTDRFHKYSAGPCGFPPPVAAKYIDQDVPDEWFGADGLGSSAPIGTLDIPTPCLDKILTHQNYTKEDGGGENLTAVNGLLGRTIYNVGEMDNWQIVPFFIGIAGAGKSEILLAFRNFYATEDIGTLSNNIEGIFGAAYLNDKFVVYATEVKRDFRLDQALFQSMISGEGCSMPCKGTDPIVVDRWTAPLVLAGNEIMRMSDNSGSIARRIAAIYFNVPVPVEDRDDSIAKKIGGELAAMLIKSNRCYHQMIREYAGRTFWDACPEMFKENRKRIEATLNPLNAFLQSTDIVLGPEKEIEETAFKNQLRDWCRQNGHVLPQWSQDLYRGPFGQNSIKFEFRMNDKGRTVGVISGCTLSSAEECVVAQRLQQQQQQQHVQPQPPSVGEKRQTETALDALTHAGTAGIFQTQQQQQQHARATKRSKTTRNNA